MQHELPYGMRAGDRTRRRLGRRHVAQQLEHGGPVPRRALERGAQLGLETNELVRGMHASMCGGSVRDIGRGLPVRDVNKLSCAVQLTRTADVLAPPYSRIVSPSQGTRGQVLTLP
jgi:hypothetical protein